MPKIFQCSYCEYETSKKSSYNNHLKSIKHNKNVNFDRLKFIQPSLRGQNCPLEGQKCPLKGQNCPPFQVQPTKTTTECIYCSKELSGKRSLRRHHKICHAKAVFEEKQRLEEELQLKQHKEEQFKKKEKKLKEELEELKEVQSDYYDLLRQIAKSKTSPQTINLHYVVNNFTEALNYEDLMNPKLTDEEADEIKQLEPIAGTINIIEKRCITNMDVKKRPLHCLDTSRNKYLVRTDNEWVVDHYAKRIFKGAAKHIHDMYATNPTTSNLSIEQIMRNQQKLLKLESKSSKNKMIKDLNDKVYIKNIKIESITKK